MKSVKLIGLTAIALILVVVAFLVTNQSEKEWSDDITGSKVFPDLNLSKVQKITIEDQAAKTTLKQVSGKWVVAERANYPADFDTLRQLVTKLGEMSILKQVKAKPNGFAELKLLSPETNETVSKDETGRLVKLMTADNSLLTSIIIGKTHRAPNRSWKTGSYIRVPESDRVVLVEGSFFSVKSDPAKWLNKDFVEVGKIKKMSRFENASEDASPEWEVTRDNEDAKLTLKSELAADKTVNEDALKNLSSALSYFRFKDVAAGDNSVTSEDAFKDSSVFLITDFNNVKTRLIVGTKTGANRYVKLNQTKPESTTTESDDTQNTSGQTKNKENTPTKNDEDDKQSKETRQLRKLVSEHIYLIPESQIKGILVKREDLVQAQQADAEATKEEEKATTD